MDKPTEKPKPSLFPPVSTFGMKPPAESDEDAYRKAVLKYLANISQWVSIIGLVALLAGILGCIWLVSAFNAMMNAISGS